MNETGPDTPYGAHACPNCGRRETFVTKDPAVLFDAAHFEPSMSDVLECIICQKEHPRMDWRRAADEAGT